MTYDRPNKGATQALSLRDAVQRPEYVSRFKEVLGERAAQFASSIIAVGSTLPSTTDPLSIIAAGMTAALLDLPVNKDLGFAHIVPYKGVAQFQMGYKGFVQLAIRTGQYAQLNACEVYEGELVSFDPLTSELKLDTSLRKSDQVIGYAAYFRLVNGYEHAVYWTAEKVKNHASKYSAAYRGKRSDSPWFTNFDAMGKKTVIKDLISHWGIMSVQLQRAILEDQGVRRSIDADAKIEYVDNQPTVSAPVFNQPTPALFGAGEPKAQEKKPLPTTPPDDNLVRLRELMVKDAKTEAQVLESMRKAGTVDDSLDSLNVIYEFQPSAIVAAIDNWTTLFAQ